jgi:hypothetical protein
VFLVVNNALTETEAEAKALLKAYEAIPDDLRDSVLEIKSTHEISLDDMFSFQNALWTAEHSEKWQLHGLCFDQSVDLDKASVVTLFNYWYAN